MNMRTESEIRAYIDGYNDCFKLFCKYLKGSKTKAVRKMKVILLAVNNSINVYPSQIRNVSHVNVEGEERQ